MCVLRYRISLLVYLKYNIAVTQEPLFSVQSSN